MKYKFSSSPHLRGNDTTKRIMLDVCLALLPACIAGCLLFGWKALILLAICVATSFASEIIYKLCSKVSLKKALAEFDFTSIVTGLLVGMNLYADSPWYVAVLTCVFAIVVVKMLFGGTGKNVVNPAIAGRIFAFISFGAALGGTFNSNMGFDDVYHVQGPTSVGATVHHVTATPLQYLFGATSELSNWDLLFGTGVNGTIGEVCKLALIIGGLYLVLRNVINWRWPVIYTASMVVLTVCLNKFNFDLAIPSILSGGFVLGAIFMATDYVTTPATKAGKYVYFVFLGLLTALLRHLTQSESVSFAILLGNLIVPLIDSFVINKPFGKVTAKEGK
ncbi:MAG: RnfABCDGE type electron transport complex subunit D [Clostridia bacterium]|nr:RnfABCDGE type electron transport complex subunit D [Clostridia bacterium]